LSELKLNLDWALTDRLVISQCSLPDDMLVEPNASEALFVLANDLGPRHLAVVTLGGEGGVILSRNHCEVVDVARAGEATTQGAGGALSAQVLRGLAGNEHPIAAIRSAFHFASERVRRGELTPPAVLSLW
jgi:fructose-1-phosphate kinase PfkB-like protein